MAVIKQGILGGIQNKIGNIVGTSWKGIAVLKSLPVTVANPRTAAQVSQRDRFKNVVIFATAILGQVIKPLWDRFAQRQSGYNAFISKNIEHFDNSGLISPQDLVISTGKMDKTDIATADGIAVDEEVTITWLNDAGQGFKQATDTAFVVIAKPDGTEVSGYNTLVQRSALGLSVSKKLTVGQTYYVWLAFRRQDGTIVSDTSYKTFVAV